MLIFGSGAHNTEAVGTEYGVCLSKVYGLEG